jgi:hypothetical protein
VESGNGAWAGEGQFASWNRRRIALWKTPARVTSNVPDGEFGFVVEVPGGKDWTA